MKVVMLVGIVLMTATMPGKAQEMPVKEWAEQVAQPRIVEHGLKLNFHGVVLSELVAMARATQAALAVLCQNFPDSPDWPDDVNRERREKCFSHLVILHERIEAVERLNRIAIEHGDDAAIIDYTIFAQDSQN